MQKFHSDTIWHNSKLYYQHIEEPRINKYIWMFHYLDTDFWYNFSHILK